ncbi:MAG TPA: mandelate racemase/muconate lactonizing enzyme family protein [Bryobacteraceae bacterium]|jgi:L-alanine-DL-glutamate epimerase-like enolase superfamily enzyme|nr:mandelate racemase/muconate lactonizing enzyme family protein [Bryobacteraceae bacterium]
MKITKIVTHVLLVPDYDRDACSSAQDDVVVLVHTDEGITGIGEVDTNPWVAEAMIHARGTHVLGLGLEEMLLGEDPLRPEALWEKMYTGSFMTGRRGLGICAMGALDMALWDIRGKALGLPCWQFLGGARKTHIQPYASLLPAGHTAKEYRESLVAKAREAGRIGFRAAKMEVCVNGPYAHNKLSEGDDAIVEIVAACREAVGPDFVMMADVCYCWSNAKEALRVIRQLEPYDLFFLETPLQLDDLDGYAFLHDHSGIPIAAGELQNTRFEFLDLMDRGKVDVAQPDVGRVGGFTEARRVCDLAAERGRLIVPHCWKTGIGIAASAHLSAATAHCPYIEFLPAQLSESALRRELVRDELQMTDGMIPVPQKPGLGIELNFDALEKFRAR